MKRASFAVACLASLAAAVSTQSHPTPRPIRGRRRVPQRSQLQSDVHFMRVGFYRGGRYVIRSKNMADLISTAYAVDPDKVLGGPNWLEVDRFDVLATPPSATTGRLVT